ncbi:AEC family transporter [Marinobacterium arenosum]|uniref:AEC family transporter n=1 Tax=Marinobacterium arenosum TaxID=2862496 RepID=UPI001C9610FC|nr:AEC family transporter [Marinobacterium arenosum]MBY4677942.1 AEC family transporter [Marinobacterium arenosum]
MEVLQALLPVILSILAGYGFRRYGGVPLRSWQHLSLVAYYLFTPALEIRVLANKPLDGLPWQGLIGSVLSVLLLLTLLLIAWQRWGRPQQAATFTSLYQGGIRFNTFIALVMAGQLFGDEGMAAVALVAAVMILLVNLLCVLIFVYYLGSEPVRPTLLLRELLSNPLIAGCLVGLALNLSGIGLGGAALSFFDLMGQAALPIGLMVVGASLQLERLKGNWEVIYTASLVQLLLKPVLALAAVAWFGLGGALAAALVLCFAVPAPPSAYVLALKKGGDSQTMAAMITVQTFFAAFSMPLVIGLI